MTTYNDEYYIAFRPRGDELVYIRPDRETAQRKYHYTKLVSGEQPLIFSNGFRDETNQKRPLTDLFVDTSGLLINDELKDKFSQYKIEGMQIYPAVFIDDTSVWHDSYWYFGFYKELDCIDLVNSEIEMFYFDDDDLLEVKRYSLNKTVLDSIDEANRLIFKVANCSKSYVFFHKSIVEFISNRAFSGVQFIKVSDFREGDQF
ncbi:imm11 family protein [Shewanella sp. 30m-9]